MRLLSQAKAAARACLVIAALVCAVGSVAASSHIGLKRLFVVEHSMYPSPPGPGSTVSRTEICFVIVQDGPVRLQVFDPRGRRVRTLVDGFRRAGPYEVWWDGKREDGTKAPAGVYWVAFSAPAEETREAQRFVRMFRL